jgi:high-affinity Fe2+/Pb2+ permease
MEKILSKLRDLIGDNLKEGYDIYEYYTSNIFVLSEPNVQSDSIKVYVNGLEHNGSGDWVFTATNNKLEVEGLVVGNVVEVNYSAYLKYSDEELNGYIRAALVYISVEKYKDFADKCGFLFPTPTEQEENLIALVACILIKQSIKSYKTPEITITFEDTMSKEQKIHKLIRKSRQFMGTLVYVDLSKFVYDEDED